MELEKIISSEIKQVREDKYYMFSALKLLAPNFKFKFISWNSYRNKVKTDHYWGGVWAGGAKGGE